MLIQKSNEHFHSGSREDLGEKGGWLFGSKDWWIPPGCAFAYQPLGNPASAGLRGSPPPFIISRSEWEVFSAAIDRSLLCCHWPAGHGPRL